MQGFKFSPLKLPPIKKVKVKRSHYRMTLFAISCVGLAAHFTIPSYEVHLAFALNLLFIVDPTA